MATKVFPAFLVDLADDLGNERLFSEVGNVFLAMGFHGLASAFPRFFAV